MAPNLTPSFAATSSTSLEVFAEMMSASLMVRPAAMSGAWEGVERLIVLYFALFEVYFAEKFQSLMLITCDAPSNSATVE